MSDRALEDVLVLELPPPLLDEELGLGLDVELDEAEEGVETVGLDDGVVLSWEDEDLDAGDELSWLDAGESAQDLDVGSEVEETEGGYLDDRPMALDLGFDLEPGEGPSGLDQGAEGLDETPARPAGAEDEVDLPPLPDVADEDAEIDLGVR